MMQISHELHAQSKGRWSIERTWTGGTKETALDHARHLYAESHISGVKVVCEKFNPETNESSETVVYDTTKKIGEKVKLKEQPKAAAARNGSATAQATARGTKGKAKVAAKKPASITSIAVLSVIMVAAIGALVVALSRSAEIFGSL
ncbi:MAG: hypothetical protein VCC99_02725 [Alphaproteobacteria bacterium]